MAPTVRQAHPLNFVPPLTLIFAQAVPEIPVEPLSFLESIVERLPPYRTAEGRPLPIGTALLLVFLTVSALRPQRGLFRWPTFLQEQAGSTVGERIAYRVDNFFSTKAYAPAALLFAITLVLVGAGGLALWAAMVRAPCTLSQR